MNTEQVTELALNTACNEMDCVNVLQCLRYFADWPPLEPYFRRKTDMLFQFVMKDIKTLTELYSKKNYWVCSYTPRYSGFCMLSIIHLKRITMIKNVSSEAKYLRSFELANVYCYKMSIEYT